MVKVCIYIHKNEVRSMRDFYRSRSLRWLLLMATLM